MKKILILSATIFLLAGCQKEEPEINNDVTVLITNIGYNAFVSVNNVQNSSTDRPMHFTAKQGDLLIVNDYQAGSRTVQISISTKPTYTETVIGQFHYQTNL